MRTVKSVIALQYISSPTPRRSCFGLHLIDCQQDYVKATQQISMKFCEAMEHDPRNNKNNNSWMFDVQGTNIYECV